MPISRYEIRNEYSLADPELYRAADKGDPEALLEGVAMAGLVGVLRQLGDLAEFAAEIFQNLHEEVMITASRGHGLIIRVQQLDTDVRFIEKEFLSRTDHSSFFHHAGVDWHPNLRINQNLITQGDLPRFVMDSYEECRAPPRLFLLDKFDIAGAGACLKRYTDPSSYRVETTGMTADVQREKKIRKAKKKGARWRNGENPEVFTTSHAKLHQLFLEERTENGGINPSHRAKLRRRLNGFPFDSKSGNSYMEKLLNSPSPDHKLLHEMTDKSLQPLMLAINDRESMETIRSPSSSPDREEVILKPPIYEPNEIHEDDKILDRPNSCSSFVTDGIKFTLDKVICEKVIAVDAESKREDSLNSYQSDDITSEIENYLDASSTIEPGLDTESELRLKIDFDKKNEQCIFDANENHLPAESSNSHSNGYSTISNEGNDSSRKEMSSSSSSDSPSFSAENPQSEKNSPKRSPSADIPEIELVDVSSYQKHAEEFFPIDHNSKPIVSDYTCSNTGVITDHISAIDLTFSSDSEGVEGKDRLREPESYEMASTLSEEENEANVVLGAPSSPSMPNPESQLGDDTPGSSAGEHLMEETTVENVPCVSTISHIKDSSVTITTGLLHEIQSYSEDHNLGSMLNTPVVLSQDSSYTPETTESLIPGIFEDKVPELPENFPSDYPGIDHIGSTFAQEEDNLIVELDNEDSNVYTVSPNCSPYIMEASPGRKLEETSFANGETVDAEENHSNSSIDTQIASEIKLSNLASSSDWPATGVDSHDRDVSPEEETASISDTVENDGITLAHDRDVIPKVENASTSDTVENDEITLTTIASGLTISEISVSADLKSLNEVHILSDESDSETDKAKSAHMASAVCAASDYTEIDGVSLPIEEKIPCFEELENDKICHSGSYTESGLVEEEGQTEGFDTVFCNTTNNDNPKAQVSDTVLSHRDLDIEQECLQENGLGNCVAGPSSPTDYNIEESVLQEQIELPQLPDSSKISYQQMPDHDYNNEDNDSAPMLSLVSCANPPSVSDLPVLNNHDIDVSENPKDSLPSNFPSFNPFSETNQINLDNLPSLPLPPVQWIMGKLQHDSSTTEKETTKPEKFPQEISPPTASTSDVSPSLEVMNHSLIQISTETTSKEEVVENSSSSFKATTMHGKIDLPTKIVNNQHQFVTPNPESESTSAPGADGIANGSRAVKLPWPRNPLINDLAAIDKSRLRKVTERVRPEIQKLDERDSFLAQIRAKSFNLKPAVASRPSIRGPKTNLNVAAILEKANAIRQAFAGSDEDDEDSWSDS